MQGTGKKELSKKILCSILAAGVLSVGGVQCVWAGGSISDVDFVDGIISSNEDYIINSDTIGTIYNSPRGYGIKLEDVEAKTIDLGANSLIIKNQLDYENDTKLNINYGTIQLGNTKLTINGNLDMDVSGIGLKQVRGIHTIENDSLIVNGNSNINVTLDGNAGKVNQDAPVSPDSAYVAGIGIWDGSDATFNGDTIVTVNAINSTSSTWANALQNAGGTVTFKGNKTDLSVENDNYTSQTIITFRGSPIEGINGGVTNFNSTEVTNLTAKSNFGANVVGFNAGVSYVNFNSKEVNLHAIISDGVGATNAIGILGGDNVIVSSQVENFNVTVEGAGVDKGNGGFSNGTAGIYENGGHTTINSQNVNVTVVSGEDTENTKFDKSQADALGDNYCTAYGLRADYSGHITIGKDTNAVIYAKDNYKNAIAVYAGDFNNGNTNPGSVEILGNATITAIGGEGTKALYAKNGGTITVGSEGKTVSLVGDVVATNSGEININGSLLNLDNVKVSDFGQVNIVADKIKFGKDSEINTINSGNINISGKLNITDNLYFNGGKYTTYDIANDITGGVLVLDKNGVLVTKADQVFTNGDATGTASGEVKKVPAVSFKGGTVNLTDAEYTFNYVQSAVEAMEKYVYDDAGNTSKTSIVMTGDLVGGLGNNKITVDNAGMLGDSVALDKVTIETSGNLLVGSDNLGSGSTIVGGIEVEDSVANGFNASSLDLKVTEGTTNAGIVITNGQNVTLGGSQGSDNLITVNGEVAESGVSVIVGVTDVDGISVNDKAGSFTIGNALATSETKYTLTGSVTVNAGSQLITNGQTTITNGVTLNGGKLDAASGVLNANVTVEANTTNTVTGTVNAGTLAGDTGAVINVGNKDKAANVVVTEANLNGSTVFIDPAWKDGVEIAGASNMAVANTMVDGAYVVGRNAMLSFGVNNTEKAQEVFAKTGLTWGEDGITAGLYIADSITLGTGNTAIMVDGSYTTTGAIEDEQYFHAGANSITMIDGSQFVKDTDVSGDFAIESVGTYTDSNGKTYNNLYIDSDAKLFIDNARNGEVYQVLARDENDNPNIEIGTDDVWSTGNIDFDNTLLVVDTENTKVDGNTFVVGAKYQKVDDAYGKGAVVIADIIDKTLADKNEGDAAFDFFNAAASENGSEAGAVAAFNSAANMGEMGGVNHAAYSVSNAMTDAVADHLSIATHGDQNKDIWAHYVHNKENIKGISLGGINADYDLQYNGIVVGSDLYKNGKATAGIALSYIEGDVNSYNIAANTKNEAEYYGASVYGRIDNGNSAVLGDITYMHGSSDITQQNSGHKLTADADTDVFSIGVKAEQKVEAGIGQFVPYAGLRYMHIGTGNYTNSIGMSYDVDEQNLWLLPVGVTYSCEAQKGDWTIRPVVEAGYVWAMGDRDTNQTVSLNGAADGFGFDTADSGSFISRFAVEAEKANVIYSLGYEYQKGDTVKANKWMANMTFTF